MPKGAASLPGGFVQKVGTPWAPWYPKIWSNLMIDHHVPMFSR